MCSQVIGDVLVQFHWSNYSTYRTYFIGYGHAWRANNINSPTRYVSTYFPLKPVFIPNAHVVVNTASSSHSTVQFWYWKVSYFQASFQFSCLVMSDSLRPHELQHVRCPCPSPIPGVHSNSRPSSRWCHPAISSCCPLLLLPPIPPSIGVFSSESALRMRWPKYWSFSFSISPSNKHPGVISFRMDCLDLLAVQRTLKSLLQHRVQRHQFFSAQLSL